MGNAALGGQTIGNAALGTMPLLAEHQTCNRAPLFIPICLTIIGLAAFGLFAGSLETLFYLLWSIVMLGWLPVLVGLVKRIFYRQGDAADAPDRFAAPPDFWQLPKVTILLPVYKEANMMQQLADAMADMRYPPERLECLVLLEADDRDTTQAAMKIRWPAFCTLMTVPHGQPKTKARACNYGLARASGSVLVIYDAEDKPHPDQIMQAATRFATDGPDLACLQAPLHIAPKPGRWLQAHFALEYRLLFYVILPCLGRSCGTLPLGGSSNYFQIAPLRAAGGWDAYNLTEDADLGIRLAKAGYRIDTIALPTIENAPASWAIWQQQRTRWLSGHIQTIYTHRHMSAHRPKDLISALVYQVVLASRLLSSLTHALAFAVLVSHISEGHLRVSGNCWFVVPALFYLVWLVVIYHFAPGNGRIWRLLLTLTHGVYWLLCLPPMLNACKRMALGQLDWLKTPHQPYTDKQTLLYEERHIESG